jgi:hypothetical protein
MKLYGKITLLALSFATAAAAVAGCDDPVGVDGEITFEIEIEPDGAWLQPGQAVVLTATVFKNDPRGVGTTTQVDSAVSWSSSNPQVATVDGDGLVDAVGFGESTITARAAGVRADVLIAVTAADFPDVRGSWMGQYRPTDCTLSGAADPFFCTDLFDDGTSLIFELQLDQLGQRVSGTAVQGTLAGFVEGSIDAQGELTLSGTLGGVSFGTSTTILDWSTVLVADSLAGGWRFLTEDLSGAGFGSADVLADLLLLDESVLQYFGCPVEAGLSAGTQIVGTLAPGDCQLDDVSYFDVYYLDGVPGDSIELVMRSSQLDAFLLIADLDENLLGTDDDSGGGINGTDAAITVVFDAPGTALVIANSFAARETGDYDLTTTALIAAPASRPLAGAPQPRSGPVIRVVAGNDSKRLTHPQAQYDARGDGIRRTPGRSIKR